MIQVLAKNAILLHICSSCGCVFKYEVNDIYESKYLYCPICRAKEEAALQLNYDGVVENV